jgi:hypothetical protein
VGPPDLNPLAKAAGPSTGSNDLGIGSLRTIEREL